MKEKIISHHLSQENLSWREFVKFGLPALTIAGIIISAFQGLASQYPALFLLLLSSTLIGLYLEGKKSIAAVAATKLFSVALLFVSMTLLTANPLFAVTGILTCFVLLIFILRKT